ncbi:MAG: hypothetical protein ACHQ52_05595 [Candidatus Eisenbacteria bacterium]
MRRVVTTLLPIGLIAAVAIAAIAPNVFAFNLRSPQIVVPPTSSDGVTLQDYFNGIGESINVETDQLDAQVWDGTGGPGNSTFTLMIELAGYATQNAIGVYNSSGGPSPTLFQMFPGAATAGWFVTAHFAGGNLSVALFDNNNVFQGSTSYTGVNANSFGFYLQGPGGTFYSQDDRNGGALAQVLTYAGTGVNQGDWFECFEDLPRSVSSDSDFQDAILLLQAIVPTPSHDKSWGQVKNSYR